MPQLMIPDAFENKFFQVWVGLWNQTMTDLLAYYTLAYESSIMGEIIFDNQLADIAKVISRDLFIKTYWQIFREQEKNGTIDAHLYILYAIFGADSTIFVGNPNPLHTIFHIQTKQISLEQWITRNGDNMVTKTGDNILFRTVFGELSNDEILSLLKATANYGEYLEFNLSIRDLSNDYGYITEQVGLAEDFGSVTVEPTVFADYGLVNEPIKG